MESNQELPIENRLAGIAVFLSVFSAPDFQFCEWTPQEYSTPFCSLSDTALEFTQAAYDLGWVRPDIDWMEWQNTREAEQLRTDASVLAHASAEQLAKLLTMYFRGDRFCEGLLASAFDDGNLQRANGLLANLNDLGKS